MSDFITKDSGQRQEFGTGSKRDTREGKGRYDLIPPLALKRLAGVYERGSAKYGDRNWEKGQPLMRYLDSAMRHLSQLIAGDIDEDHAAQAAWNLFSYMWTLDALENERLPDELDDRPVYPEPGSPTFGQEFLDELDKIEIAIAKHKPAKKRNKRTK